MTQSTEQERAEFERTIGVDYDLTPSTIRQGQYAVPVTQAAWYGWQTARRAPAVPVPQKGWRYVPEVLTPEMKREFMDMLMDGIDIYMNSNDQIEIQTDAPRRIWKSILAAAPQPPEADHIPDTGKMVAVPVQMPEPAAWRYTDARGHYRYRGARPGFAVEYPLLKPEAIYTEQQVRELLAAHGIKVAP